MADETPVAVDAAPDPDPSPSPPPPFILESERRWADFDGLGRAIELPDGQAWVFYEPEAVMRNGRPGWTFGGPADIDAILSARFNRILAKWERAADESERASAILDAAYLLLIRNYALKRDEFGRIVARAAGWPEDRQREFGEAILIHVGMVCSRAAGLAEVA